MPTTTTAPGLPGALATAACLLTTAALVHVAGAAAVRVVVHGTDIDIQIPLGSGDQSARDAALAAYAQALGTEVTHQHDRVFVQAWVETRGRIGGHDVRVWTITDPSLEA
jgi:hypothetical protein